MSKHRRNALLLIAGAALSIALALWFDLHKYFLAWFWSIEDTIALIGKTWLVRRLERPITALLMRWVIIGGLGFGLWGIWRRKLTSPLWTCHAWARGLWPILSVPYRVLAACGALSIIAGLFWITWLVPLILPISGFLIGKLYWWGSDQLFDRTLYLFRWRALAHRIEHRNKAVRLLMGPYWLLRKAVETRLESWRERRQATRQQNKNDQP